MTRDELLINLNDIIINDDGMMEEEAYIKLGENSLIYVDKFLELFGGYELTLSSLKNVDSSIWKERFEEWNERGILPD